MEVKNKEITRTSAKKQKQKKGSGTLRIFFAVALIIAFGTALYFYLDWETTRNQVEKDYDENVLSEEMIIHYLDNDFDKLVAKKDELQVSPDLITKFNALITQIIYSNELTEKQIGDLIELQRMCYGEGVLTKNPYDVQLERLVEDLELYKELGESGLKVIGYELTGPDFEVVDGEEYAFINVLYYLSIMNIVEEGNNGDEGNLYVSYVLEEVDGRWVIKGWGPVDEFLIVD